MAPELTISSVVDKNTNNKNKSSQKRSLEDRLEQPVKILNREDVKADPDLYSLTGLIEPLGSDDNKIWEPIERNDSMENNESTNEEEQEDLQLQHESISVTNKSQSVSNDGGNERSDIISNKIPSGSNQQRQIDQLSEPQNAERLVQLFEEYSNENGYRGEIFCIRDSNKKMWFAAKDLERILGYSASSKPLKNHVAKENKIKWSALIVDEDKLSKNYEPDTMFIDVQGVRDLIVKSPKKKTEEFFDWAIDKFIQTQSPSTSRQSQLVSINNNENSISIQLINNKLINMLENFSNSHQTICESNRSLALSTERVCRTNEKLVEQQLQLTQQILSTPQNNQQNNDNFQEYGRITQQQQQQWQQQPSQQQQRQQLHQPQRKQQRIKEKTPEERSLQQAIIILRKKNAYSIVDKHKYNYKFIQRQLKTLAVGVKELTRNDPKYKVVFEQDHVLDNGKVFDTVTKYLSNYGVKFSINSRRTQLQTSVNLREFLNNHKITL